MPNTSDDGARRRAALLVQDLGAATSRLAESR